MTTLLHPPIRDAAQLADVVRASRRESAHLEFKAKLWEIPAGSSEPDHMREAAKDVAALANGLGGDILVGVAAQQSAASGYSRWCVPGHDDRSRENLRGWLKDYLQPSSFADLVETRLVSAPPGSACANVLVVTVPPAIGLVAAVVSRADNSVRFPIRSEDGTRWVSMEEAMSRFNMGTRASFLRLATALTGNEDRFRIVSPFEAVITRPAALTGQGPSRWPVPARGGSHGLIGKLSDSAVIVRVRPDGWQNPSGSVAIQEGAEVSIPLDFVRAAWRVADVVHLALTAKLLWDGATLVLEVS